MEQLDESSTANTAIRKYQCGYDVAQEEEKNLGLPTYSILDIYVNCGGQEQ